MASISAVMSEWVHSAAVDHLYEDVCVLSLVFSFEVHRLPRWKRYEGKQMESKLWRVKCGFEKPAGRIKSRGESRSSQEG